MTSSQHITHLSRRIARIDVILRRTRSRHSPRWERLLAHRNDLLVERYEAETPDDDYNEKWRQQLYA